MTRPDLPFAADCETILYAALAARDWRGVEAALLGPTVQDPARALLLYDTLKVGVALADERTTR